MPLYKVSQQVLDAVFSRLSDVGTGYNPMVVTQAAAYGIDPTSMKLDFSKTSLGFYFDQIEAEDLEKSGLITYPFGSLYILDSVQTGVQKFSQFSGAVRCVFEVGISWVPIKGMQNREAYSNCVEDAVFAVINGLANQNWGAPLVYNGGIQCRRGQTKFGGMNFRKVVAFPMLFELHQ